MARGQAGVLGQLRVLFTAGSFAGVPDRQLLERFILRRDEDAEAAFAALVARYGPMVFKLCCNILRDRHDAEDAFQATFMLLAVKAPRIRDRELLGNWLYGVALRTAMKARTRAVRRRRHERRAADRSVPVTAPHHNDFELQCALHEGIRALPEKYRAAIVLCHLQGLTREQAAPLLRCTASTVGVRLMRARERLRAWLTRRHQDYSPALVIAGLDSWKAAMAPSALLEATTAAGLMVRAGFKKAVVASSASIELMKEVRMSLAVSKLKIVAASLLVCVLFAAGVVTMAQPQKAATPTRSAEEEIAELERAWGQALINRDAATMDRIVGYEMVGTDPAGNLWNKAQYLESVKAGAFKVESFEIAELKVHVYGNAAIAFGLGIINKHSKSGFSRGGSRSTDTYVCRNGCWQCVAWQSAAVGDLPQPHATGPQEVPKTPELAIPLLPSESPAPIATEHSKIAEPTSVTPGADSPKMAPIPTDAKPAEPKAAPGALDGAKATPTSTDGKAAPGAAPKPAE
jgi:RNA polymerase sigma factor (sigma-70 family)